MARWSYATPEAAKVTAGDPSVADVALAEGEPGDKPAPEQAPVTGSTATDTKAIGCADAVYAALAKSLEAATAAGEWAVVAQLARELEARRLEAHREH